MCQKTRKGDIIRHITDWTVKENEPWFLRGRGCNVIWDKVMQKFNSAGAAQSRETREQIIIVLLFSKSETTSWLFEVFQTKKLYGVQWKWNILKLYTISICEFYLNNWVTLFFRTSQIMTFRFCSCSFSAVVVKVKQRHCQNLHFF